MAIRVKWDKYETALLIDAFWRIEESPEKKKEIIAELSQALRRRAINLGIEIDDIFRNVNGISMQLSPIAHAFFPERSTLTSSTMFRNMVELYKINRNVFDEILKIAKNQVRTNQMNISYDKADLDRRNVLPSLFSTQENVTFDNSQNKIYLKNTVDKQDTVSTEGVIIMSEVATHKNSIQETILDCRQDDVEHAVMSNKSIFENVFSTLKGHFIYGFNISSPIEMMRFRAHYETDHQVQCPLDDEALKITIADCGLTYNGKIYVINQEIKDRISEMILNRINSGEIIFYYDEIYSSNEEWFYNEHIVDADMLKVILVKLFPNYRYKERFFITRNSHITELNALKEVILHSWGTQVLHTFKELKELLPFIPYDKIRYTLSISSEFTWNSLETYTRNDLFVISNEQIEDLIRFVSMKCVEGGSVTFGELPLEDIAAENYELSETALNDIVFSYLPECFSRNGKVISRSNYQHNTITAIQQYCGKHEICTMKELQQIMLDAEGVVRYPVVIEAANAVMVRVSQDEYVADYRVSFDVSSIDKALDEVVVGNGIGLKELNTFSTFPFCGVAWNHFVLESYCRRFSAKYKYLCLTPNSKNAGAIILKTSVLSYHDIMAEALARSGVKLIKKDAFDYLINSGFLIRRRYSGMGDLLNKSAALRKGGD